MANFRIKKNAGTDTRLTLIGLATNEEALATFEPHYDHRYFEGPAAEIAKWCVSYFRKYGSAPNARLQDRFESWCEKKRDKELVTGMERLLGQLSENYGSNDYKTEFLLDAIERFVNNRRKQILTEEMEDSESPAETSKLMEHWAPLNLTGAGDSVDLTSGFREVTKRNKGQNEETLIEFPGDLGKFFGTMLRRGGLIMFQAPEKTGKTFWLLELFYLCTRSMRQKWNAHYFECGDLTEAEWFDRLASRTMGVCCEKPNADVLRIPESIDPKTGEPVFREKDFRMLTDGMRDKASDRFSKRAKGRVAKYHQASAGSRSTADIRNMLKQEKRAGRSVDLLAIDYADILNHRIHGDGRDGINGTWIDLRAIAREFKCCIVTATQSDSGVYGRDTQTASNFSEDKRKYSHATGVIGLNKLSRVEGDVYLLQWLFRRSGAKTRDVLVGGCLDVSKPVCCSVFSQLRDKELDSDF